MSDDIVAELRDCADWLDTVTKQIANTARTENLDAGEVHRTVTAMRKAAALFDKQGAR
jgi:hypothetical protein